MLWHVCTMDDGVIFTGGTKKKAVEWASTLKLSDSMKTQKSGEGCYEYIGNDNQLTCIWIIRDDCLELHGFKKISENT